MVVFRRNMGLIVEGVMSNLLHVIPVVDNAMLNWVLECKDTSLCLSFITHIAILLTYTNHDTGVSWSTSTYYAMEDSACYVAKLMKQLNNC
jgi:hypothetical protein